MLFHASNCLNCVHNCDDHSLLDFFAMLYLWWPTLKPKGSFGIRPRGKGRVLSQKAYFDLLWILLWTQRIESGSVGSFPYFITGLVELEIASHLPSPLWVLYILEHMIGILDTVGVTKKSNMGYFAMSPYIVCKAGTLVRAVASNQCCLCFILGLNTTFGLILLVSPLCTAVFSAT